MWVNHHLPETRPKLKTVSLLETMRATGLSRTYCGMFGGACGFRIRGIGKRCVP
jgi:hypothetical protein